MSAVTFSGRTKKELCTLPLGPQEELLAEAYGVLMFCNQFSASHLRIVTTSPAFAQRVVVLFRGAFDLSFDRISDPDAGRRIFEITQRRKLQQILERCDYDIATLISIHVNFGLLESRTNRLAFLRGAFLAGGSVTDPEKRYHLEFSTSHSAVSREVQPVLEECGFRGKTIFRNGNYLTYFKQSSEIARLLEAMGARSAAEQVHTTREVKVSINKANRRSNCDLANVDKTVAAAREQLAAIRQLEEQNRLADLPEKLQEAARLRLDYPELSLTQLGELCDPPVTKSAFNYRLKKLIELSGV